MLLLLGVGCDSTFGWECRNRERWVHKKELSTDLPLDLLLLRLPETVRRLEIKVWGPIVASTFHSIQVFSGILSSGTA